MNTTCRRCQISVANEFKPCWRTGDDADILFIGEAPGHTENKTKIPFTGKSGTYLRTFMNRYGLTNFSQITNVIKCQPPRNREPEIDEIANCSSYLVEDIKAVNPKLIICVGSTSTKVFVGEKGFYLRKYLNIPFAVGNAIAIPIYHPSYIMREGVIAEYLKSFNLISDYYNKINPYYSKRKFKLNDKA